MSVSRHQVKGIFRDICRLGTDCRDGKMPHLMRLVLEIEEMIGTGVSHPGRRTSSKDGCVRNPVSV